MSNFELDGKKYEAVDLDFYYLVVLDKAGIGTENITGVAALNCYIAYCMGVSEKEASDAVSKHIIEGGSIDKIGLAYREKLDESDFFRALLAQTEEQENEKETKTTGAESPKKKTTKSVKEA